VRTANASRAGGGNAFTAASRYSTAQTQGALGLKKHDSSALNCACRIWPELGGDSDVSIVGCELSPIEKVLSGSLTSPAPTPSFDLR
jgi:hypothetical protein